jgi:hypothetical protein
VKWFIGEGDGKEQRDKKGRTGLGLGLGVFAEVREGLKSWAGEGRSAAEVQSSGVGPWSGTRWRVDTQEDK